LGLQSFFVVQLFLAAEFLLVVLVDVLQVLRRPFVHNYQLFAILGELKVRLEGGQTLITGVQRVVVLDTLDLCCLQNLLKTKELILKQMLLRSFQELSVLLIVEIIRALRYFLKLDAVQLVRKTDH
jgi:hypothetical protein